MLGNWGHFSLVLAFVAILMAMYGYFMADRQKANEARVEWIRFSNVSFVAHTLAVISASITLFWIVFHHHYEYQYAWKHSSNELPLHFLISCLWEGQEGSFLLWMLFNALVGLLLIRSKTDLMPMTMCFFGLTQFFLSSMILGSYLGEIKLGSSPFLLLKDTMAADIYQIDPNFVPLEGSGLNPLLQNIWMAIHPPVIFLSFSIAGVPFAQTLAALYKAQFNEYIKHTAPWVLATAGIMGIGIVMGAYWAYETLNFGGYWNWDPVENAVFVPWLMAIAACHGIVLYKRKQKGLVLTMTIILSAFLLVVYSTFLTRSGILGNASVHSFTDLGLSGQLLLFLIFLTAVSIVLFVIRRRQIKETDFSSHLLSLEFWMLLGICTFGLSAFQILLPTSIPVLNSVLSFVGINKSFAPPADQVAFYSKFQVWFASCIALLAGVGQVLYWRKIKTNREAENELLVPLTITLIASALIIYLGQTRNIGYICLITSAIFLITISLRLGWVLIQNSTNRSLGGLLAHLGMALMLLGFVYSAGHQKVLSQNMSINMPESNLPVHSIQENLALTAQKTKTNDDISFRYMGRWLETKKGEKVPYADLISGAQPDQKIVKENSVSSQTTLLNRGEILQVKPENTFYKIGITYKGESFSILPRVQNNPNMGYIPSPDINSSFGRDIYTHITNFPDPQKVQWSEPILKKVSLGELIEVKGLTMQIQDIKISHDLPGIKTTDTDIPLEASIKITDQNSSYTAHPVYHIDQHGKIRLFPDEITDLGIKIMLTSIDPVNQQYNLSILTSQRDWITIKCIEMPFISLVWLGAITLTLGVGIAYYFRLKEAQQPVQTFVPIRFDEPINLKKPRATINI